MKNIAFWIIGLLATSTVQAQEGSWKITSAKVPNGGSYTGSVAIAKVRQVHQLSWQTTGGNYTGVGILKGSTLYAGYGINIDYGVVVYELKADGSLEGIWATNKTGGMTGTEKVVGGKALNGTYDITGTNAGNNSPYKGTLTIQKTGSVYSLVWKTGNVSYNGVGILDGNTLAVGWGFGAAFGVVNYKINGNTAQGIWAMGGGMSTGTENLSK
ncbi:MAG: hypothetical protein U0Y10_04380 [Spirosomataceae bacterium]